MFQKKETKESSILKYFAFICVIAICIVMMMPDVLAEATTTGLNTNKISVYVGQTYMLKLHGASGRVTWVTSDKSVATVEKGKVTAVGYGTTVIMAKYHKKTYECTVTVEKPKLNTTEVYLEKGETFLLKLKGDKIGNCLVGDSDIVKAKWEDASSSLELSAQSAGTTKITILTEHNTKLRCDVVVRSKNKDELQSPSGNKNKGNVPSKDNDESQITTDDNEETMISTGDHEKTTISSGDDKKSSASTGDVEKSTICSHKWPKDGTVVVPASCNQTGRIKYCCVLCGELLEEKTIPRTEHDFCNVEDGTVFSPVSCTSNGYNTVTCKICGKTKNIKVPAIGHKYAFDHKVEPTCTCKGYDVSVCEHCKKEVKENYIDALGHDFSVKNWIGQQKRYDCLRGGIYNLMCSRCNCTQCISYNEAPTGKHDFKCIKVEQAENCESPSKYYYECSVCKATQTFMKQDVSHTYGESVIIPPEKSTQRDTGYTEETCTRCGYVHRYDYTSWVYTPENVQEDIQRFMNEVCPEGSYVGVCEEFKSKLLGYLGLHQYLSYTQTDFSNPKPGDVIFWDNLNGQPGHVAVIMEVRGDSLVLAEGNLNWDKCAHYGRIVPKSIINTTSEINGVTCMVTLASAYK